MWSFSRLTILSPLSGCKVSLILIVANAIRVKLRMLWEHAEGGLAGPFVRVMDLSLHSLAILCKIAHPSTGMGLGWAPAGRRKPDPLSSARCHSTLGGHVQARPTFVCRSLVFIHACPHRYRVIFQCNLTMATGLSPRRLDSTDEWLHKLAPRKEI